MTRNKYLLAEFGEEHSGCDSEIFDLPPTAIPWSGHLGVHETGVIVAAQDQQSLALQSLGIVIMKHPERVRGTVLSRLVVGVEV